MSFYRVLFCLRCQTKFNFEIAPISTWKPGRQCNLIPKSKRPIRGTENNVLKFNETRKRPADSANFPEITNSMSTFAHDPRILFSKCLCELSLPILTFSAESSSSSHSPHVVAAIVVLNLLPVVVLVRPAEPEGRADPVVSARRRHGRGRGLVRGRKVDRLEVAEQVGMAAGAAKGLLEVGFVLQVGLDPGELLADGVLQSGAVPATRAELELAFVDGTGRAQTDAVHEFGVPLAKVDLQGERRLTKEASLHGRTEKLLFRFDVREKKIPQIDIRREESQEKIIDSRKRGFFR